MSDKPPFPGEANTIRIEHSYSTRLRERFEEVLRENVVWGAGAVPDRIISALVEAVGDETAKRILVMTCTVHGEIAREEVWCAHDNEEVMRRVATAHGASYGGGCRNATLNVELIEP